jgi:hypothetical protein
MLSVEKTALKDPFPQVGENPPTPPFDKGGKGDLRAALTPTRTRGLSRAIKGEGKRDPGRGTTGKAD